MKKILGFLFFIVYFIFFTCLFADVKISKFTGSVLVFQNQVWVAAKPDMVLKQQDKVKTSLLSRLELIMDETSRIWVHENSEVEMNSLGNESMFNLILGKIRAKIKLKQGGKFSVKTPTAVCAVRGTEFIASDNGVLQVLDGIVAFSNSNGSANSDVPAGQYATADAGGGVSAPAPIPNEQMVLINQEWSGFEDMKQEGNSQPAEKEQKETKKEDLKNEMAALQQELHTIVADMKSDIEVTREIVNEIKEADFATGRSLKDIHGNLVRVEQQLLRPDSQTMQFLNLTKRDSYVYGGKFKYEGPSTSRLDVLETKVTFNKPLPSQITEWPGFISGQEADTFYPQSVYCKVTNQTDKLELIGETRDKGQLDNEGKVLTGRSIIMDTYINGWKIDEEYDAGDKSISANGEVPGDLWATNISPNVKVEKDGQTKYINLFTESYAINNEGKLLNLKDFTSTSENPFTVLKEVAGEMIVSVREGNTVDSMDFLSKGNIDIVITPDIVVSIAQKLATQASEIADSVK
ncbi:MAG: FecR family protein [Elusimicrobia bacterium]|nr:FecR family protein [Elusimicrobiota bacterium]